MRSKVAGLIFAGAIARNFFAVSRAAAN